MLERLVESDTAGADFKTRRRYFAVSVIIVGTLFLTAVIYSLYAADVGLGSSNFLISELAAPLEASNPVTTEPKRPLPNSGDRSAGSRNSGMARVDEPTIVSTGTSAKPNSKPPRSWEGFNPNLPISTGSGGTPGDGPGIRLEGLGSYDPKASERDEAVLSGSTPPPVIRPKPPAITRISKVLNGSALSLPKPAYPKPAVMLNLEGIVNVQVTIDENGNVISAKAADGHPFFRGVAEQAAREAKFKPTMLNDAPVKVTGIIVHRFKRS